MTRPLRILLTTSTSTSSSNSTLVESLAEPPRSRSQESDFVVVLAALLCAIICAVGLIAVARCAWLRRRTSGDGSPAGQPNRGLKKKTLQSLPKFTYGSSTDGKEAAVTAATVAAVVVSECAICLAEYEEGDEIRILPQCGHGFHVNCIDTWLGSHSSCPSCRQILVVARCHKCGEIPVIPAAGTPAQAKAKATEDRARTGSTSSTVATFLP